MCVRDLVRRKCQASRRTFKAQYRQSHTLMSISRREPTKRTEDVDLFCTELLSHRDPQGNQVHSLEFERLAPEMIDNSAVFDVHSTSFDENCYRCTKLSSDCKRYELKDWNDIFEKKARGNVEYGAAVSSLDIGAGPIAHERTAEVLIGAVDFQDFGLQESGFSTPLNFARTRAWQNAEPETCASTESSLQSKYLPIQLGEPFSTHMEEIAIEITADCPSMWKQHNCVRNETSPTCDGGNNTAAVEPGCKLQFWDAMGVLLEKQSAKCYQLSKRYIEKLRGDGGQNYKHNKLRNARREIVKWIFKVVGLLQLSFLTAAHAVSFLDRFLSQRLPLDPEGEMEDEMRLAATACVWIAAKLEDSCAPDLSSLLDASAIEHNTDDIRRMEVSILRSLGWRMLGATASDFLVNMVALLPALGLPCDLLRPVGDRSEEIIKGILSEVEFLAYQPSVVSITVMQCLLDECVPMHTASLMAAFHLVLAVDGETEMDFGNLVVDPEFVYSLPSPDQVVCASSKEYDYFRSDSSDSNALHQLSRLPISAF